MKWQQDRLICMCEQSLHVHLDPAIVTQLAFAQTHKAYDPTIKHDDVQNHIVALSSLLQEERYMNLQSDRKFYSRQV